MPLNPEKLERGNFPPQLGRAFLCQVLEPCETWVSWNPPPPVFSRSVTEALLSVLRVSLTVELVLLGSERKLSPGRDGWKGAVNLKIEGSPSLARSSKAAFRAF